MFVFFDGSLNLKAHFFPDVVFHAEQCIRHSRRCKRWNVPAPRQDLSNTKDELQRYPILGAFLGVWGMDFLGMGGMIQVEAKASSHQLR